MEKNKENKTEKSYCDICEFEYNESELKKYKADDKYYCTLCRTNLLESKYSNQIANIMNQEVNNSVELKRLQTENDWLVATVQGLIKEAETFGYIVISSMREKYKVEVSDKELFDFNKNPWMRFDPWRAIELPEGMFKRIFPHDWEVKEKYLIQIKEKKLEEIEKLNKNR